MAQHPSREIPSELLDLAMRAIQHGSPKVSIHLEGMGFEFPAPIGWLLRIVAPGDCSPGAVPEAMHHAHRIGDDPDDLVAPAWLEGAPPHIALAPLFDCFRSAVENGWSASYERCTLEQQGIQRSLLGTGKTWMIGLRHKLTCSAHDWAAWTEGSDSDSQEYVLGMHEGRVPGLMAFGPPTSEPITTLSIHREPDVVIALLQRPAPGRRDVAYYSEDLDDWVL